MPEPGLYVTTDDGQHWQTAKATGVAGRVRSLAVYPTQGEVVALGTTDGLFLSRDAGETFQPLMRGPHVLALFFAFDGQYLWVSSFDGTPTLSRLSLQSGQVEPVNLPSLDRDAVSYIAQSPTNKNEWAIATFQRDIYLSSNDGSSWKKIAQKGKDI